jgi:hypothetical protein
MYDTMSKSSIDAFGFGSVYAERQIDGKSTQLPNLE